MIQLILAIWVGKLIQLITRVTKVGGGSAAPGLYALKIDPNIVEKLSSQIPTNIVITGTNGKTTTARLLNHFAKANNLKVIRNSTGSNLERGIASTLINNTSIFAKIKKSDLAIWEVDEAAFNKVAFDLKPQIIVFLNAFRDQLDRYGEVDTVVEKWWHSVSKMSWDPTIVINGSDANTMYLGSASKKTPIIFRVKDHLIEWEKTMKVTLPKTKPEFEAIIKSISATETTFIMTSATEKQKITFPLPGVYNVYNFLAAFAVTSLLKLAPKKSLSTISEFSPAFGRFEKINIGNNNGFIFLIKNPVGATLVIETIASQLKKDDRLLIALNDNFADGKDVSWIWDAKFEMLSAISFPLSVFCSGTRAEDMALRLKYAGVPDDNIILESNMIKAFEEAKRGLKATLYILPTYTALLELQKYLAKSGAKKHYWKEEV